MRRMLDFGQASLVALFYTLNVMGLTTLQFLVSLSRNS